MKRIYTFTLPFLLALCAYAWGEERIAGTLENVDLIVEDVYSEKGHDCGERYFGINRNHSPIRLSIKLTEAKNAEDKLVPYTIVAKPLEKIKLGKVIQTNPKEDAYWNYEWEVLVD